MKNISVPLLAAWLLLAVPASAAAQFFLASRPSTEISIGPLIVRASVTPALNPITVDVMWSLTVSQTRSALGLEQDLYLLWPGPVMAGPPGGAPDAALRRYVEARGFTVIAEGRLPLFAQNLFPAKDAVPTEPIASGAPYVTFVRHGLLPLGLASAATYIRIPWTHRLVNRTWLINLRLTVDGLAKQEKLGWLQSTFTGPRYLLSIGFGDIRDHAMFAMYLEHRNRVIDLASEPSQLLVRFGEADRLRIDEVFPPSSGRRVSEVQENTTDVTFFLDTSGSRTPQLLTVRFGYFSGLQTWAPILIPVIFFLLGRMTGPFIERLARRAAGNLLARVHVGKPNRTARASQEGVVLGGDALAQIVPGETSYAEVLRLCGGEVEEQERRGLPGRRTLIYRGRRAMPQQRPLWGWISTVSHWDVEHHEVEINFQQDVVEDVQVRLRRSRLSHPENL